MCISHFRCSLTHSELMIMLSPYYLICTLWSIIMSPYIRIWTFVVRPLCFSPDILKQSLAGYATWWPYLDMRVEILKQSLADYATWWPYLVMRIEFSLLSPDILKLSLHYLMTIFGLADWIFRPDILKKSLAECATWRPYLDMRVEFSLLIF